MPTIIKCPECGQTLEELNYKARFSESCYGRSYGVYRLTGNENDEDGYDGEYEVQDSDVTTSEDWEEEDYEYECPHCQNGVNPADCVINEEENTEIPQAKFKVGDEVLSDKVKKSMEALIRGTEEVGIVKKVTWSTTEECYKYKVLFPNYWNIPIFKESDLRKPSERTQEWQHVLQASQSGMIDDGIMRNDLKELMCICEHCNHTFIGQPANYNGRNQSRTDECPKCNKPLNS